MNCHVTLLKLKKVHKNNICTKTKPEPLFLWKCRLICQFLSDLSRLKIFLFFIKKNIKAVRFRVAVQISVIFRKSIFQTLPIWASENSAIFSRLPQSRTTGYNLFHIFVFLTVISHASENFIHITKTVPTPGQVDLNFGHILDTVLSQVSDNFKIQFQNSPYSWPCW